MAEEEKAATSRTLSAYGRPLEMMTSFRYLVRVILAANGDWPAVIRDMAKARAVWRRIRNIFIKEGERSWVYIFLFPSLVQSVLIFYAETWVVNPRMGRVQGGFQDQVARQLTSVSRGGGETEVGLHLGGNGKSKYEV